MNIVIEGCDGTGKSTLAKFLCKTFGLRYWHESAPRTFEEYSSMLSYGGTVFDRFCFGQFVYNSENDRKMTTESLQRLIKEVFPATQTLLIYVDCSTDTIFSRLVQRGEGSPEVRIEMEKWIKNIRGTYRSVLRNSGATFMELNGENGLCIMNY